MRLIVLTVGILLCALSAVGQDPCSNAALGLHLRLCQPCGSPGLDDFCLKNYRPTLRQCNPVSSLTYVQSSFYGWWNTGGSSGAVPPVGYLTSGTPPASCQTLLTAAASVPLRGGGTGVPVYVQAGSWSTSLPRVSFNSILASYLLEVRPTSNCLENNAPFPNGVWNVPYGMSRIDSFTYLDVGNYTWSYQCYCDFCFSCQSCTYG